MVNMGNMARITCFLFKSRYTVFEFFSSLSLIAMRESLIQLGILVNGSDHDSLAQFLLTIFRMAAFEWFAAVEMSSSDSAIKVAAVIHFKD